jgi:hypothetical protein
VVITTVTGVRLFATSTRQKTLQVERKLFRPGLHLITLYQGDQVTSGPLVVR